MIDAVKSWLEAIMPAVVETLVANLTVEALHEMGKEEGIHGPIVVNLEEFCAPIRAKDGGWDSVNEDADGNHIIPVARIKDRWLIMDLTWDSPNNYEHKYYGGGHGVKYPYRYFDASIEFISQTHKFERAWNI